MRRTLGFSLAIALAMATPTQGREIDPAAYPQLSVEQLLPALISGLKRSVPDAYSIRDLTVCPARNVKLKNGMPASWALQLAFNAKSESGGYTGLLAYVALFKDGKVTQVLRTSLATKDALDRLIDRAILRRMADCTAVPDETVQQLLQTAPAL
jgi:hypothetical protein